MLAAGLRDNCRAALVGQRTFGKGKIQAVFGLSNGEGLTMTVAQYLTPLKGKVIQSRGIEPDIAIDSGNPYLKLAVSSLVPSISRPDLESMPFEQAEQILKTQCSSTPEK